VENEDLNQWLTEQEDNLVSKNEIASVIPDILGSLTEALGVKFFLPKIIAYAY
jgi:importin-5